MEQLRYLTLFFLLILFFAGCSKRAIEKKPVHEPAPIEVVIPGLIPESVIQKAEQKYDLHVRKRYELFNAMILRLQDSSTELKLEEVNNFFNRVPYIDDIKVWGKTDYWATPLEFLGRDKGDCEDYVIAKYFSLLHLGVDSKKLYFSYVKARGLTRTHMVLSYFETPSSIPLVLDSINFKIFPANKRGDLTPIYNFNGESLYRVRKKGQNGKKVTITDRVHQRWDRLVNDVRRNKL